MSGFEFAPAHRDLYVLAALLISGGCFLYLWRTRHHDDPPA
jgi:hypothetical protein